MESIRLKACAKINLSLDVLGRRPDGYHDIESLMQGVSMFDWVFLTDSDDCPYIDIERGAYLLKENWFGKDETRMKISLAVNAPNVPLGIDNLAVKAARVLAEAMEERGIKHTRYLTIYIDKRLPVAAGIAGGSGNAAAVMLGFNHAEGNPFSLEELMALGVKIGADIPFSLMMNAAMNRELLDDLEGIEKASIAAWTSGIGDIIKPAEPIHRHVILVNPSVAVSTREVYEAIDALPESAREPKGIWNNMMEEYTLAAYDEAAVLKEVLEGLEDAEHVLMSGSGPTMVAYYTSADKAENDADIITEVARRNNLKWRVWLAETGMDLEG